MKEALKLVSKKGEVSAEEAALHERLTTLASRLDEIIDGKLAGGKHNTVGLKTIALFDVDRKPKEAAGTVATFGHIETEDSKLQVLVEKTATMPSTDGPIGKDDYRVEIDDNKGSMRIIKKSLFITKYHNGKPPIARYLTIERGEVRPSTTDDSAKADLLSGFENVIRRLPVQVPAKKKAARRA